MLVYDINVDSAKRFVREVETTFSHLESPDDSNKVDIAKSPRSLAENSDIIFTVLPESSHVESAIKNMISPNLPKPPSAERRIFIDCSTIDPSTSRRVAHSVHQAGKDVFVDAPMSGGVVGARAGTLTFMLGAPPDLVHHVQPVLLMMGKAVHRCGEQGAGLSAKLANNYLLALLNIATAEAMNLGIRCGLDAKVLAQLINMSTGRNWCSEINNPVPGVVDGAPASRGYSGGFGVKLMKKDLELAISAAEQAGAKLELHQRTREVYDEVLRNEGYKGCDFSVVYKYLQEMQ
ncbi:MAG: hypothetical protein M1816_004160 [Peltula sp. TS41687]|nr:MAG: hypothetical protein M1816_004160 [Peltula sp. TS41687]